MKQWIKTGAPMIALALMVGSASANPITGFVNFSGGQMTLSGGVDDYDTATAISGFTGTTTVTTGPTQTGGSYVGTGGDIVTFEGTPISLSVGGSSASNPIWTYKDAVTGWTYSFNLASITTISRGANDSGLLVAGTGTLFITGTGSPYDATPGTWSLSSTSSSGALFNFDSAGAAGVPDGGTTAMLLGGALVGLQLIKRKLTS